MATRHRRARRGGLRIHDRSRRGPPGARRDRRDRDLVRRDDRGRRRRGGAAVPRRCQEPVPDAALCGQRRAAAPQLRPHGADHADGPARPHVARVLLRAERGLRQPADPSEAPARRGAHAAHFGLPGGSAGRRVQGAPPGHRLLCREEADRLHRCAPPPGAAWVGPAASPPACLLLLWAPQRLRCYRPPAPPTPALLPQRLRHYPNACATRLRYRLPARQSLQPTAAHAARSPSRPTPPCAPPPQPSSN